MIYTLHEDSERIRRINFRDGNNASWKAEGSDHDKVTQMFYQFKNQKEKDDANKDKRRKDAAYISGNTFESLAKTNPELFNVTKLKALQASENLVKDFNEYMASVFGNDIDRFGKFVESIKTETDNSKIESQFKSKFNQSFHVALYERYKDLMARGVEEKEAARIVTSEFFPESLDEEGIRKAINLRIANNRCLTDNLMTMLKQNYQLFNLSKAEAESLMKDLDNDDKNNEAIGKIKEFLANPKLLDKFKSGNNYDFRSIGGAVVFMPKDNDIRLSEHPSKNLAWIFKYDAIVSAHGSSMKQAEYDSKAGDYGESDSDAENDSAIEILNSRKNMLNYINTILQTLRVMKKDIETKKVIIKDDSSKFIQYYYRLSDIVDAIKSSKRINIKDFKSLLLNIRDIMKVYLNAKSDSKSITPQRIIQDMNLCYKVYQTLYSNKNPKQAIKDGKSANWTIQSISTLSKSNLTRVIDIVRALKEEGFKKILISSCNPGGIELPKDIRNSDDFKVTYATTSILKEEYVDPEFEDLYITEEYLDNISNKLASPYRNLTINELYTEYDNLCMLYPINEGIVDKIKEFAKRAWQIIVELWRKLISAIKNIIIKIRDIFTKTFGKNEAQSLEEPIEVHSITLDGDKANIKTQACVKPLDIEKAFSDSNRSLEYAIQFHAKREMQYMKQYNDRISMNNLLKNGIKKESSIFLNISFI